MNIVALRAALISHALSLGLFSSVSGHEPKTAPPAGLYGALWLEDFRAAPSGLTSTSMRLTFSFRIGTNMIAQPEDDTDLNILVATAALMGAYSGDFTLGGESMNIDLLGPNGLAAKAGYLNQDGHLYRVMVITIPFILNDVFVQVAQ
jgi:hypothetical protein